MTTYNTYAEAKIANPTSKSIIKDMYGKFHVYPGGFEIPAGVECDPKDYCMTLEEFLKKGYKLVKNDVVEDSAGIIINLSAYFNLDDWNKPHSEDKDRYILRAKALETQPAKVEIDNTPQQVESLSSAATAKEVDNGVTKVPTKVKYVLVEDSIFDLRDDFEQGKLYYSVLSQGEKFVQIKPNTSMAESYLVGNYQARNLYRRIEKEVDWRDIVKQDFAVWFDESKVGMKMAFSEENYLEMCRVTLRAIGEIE